MGSTWVEGFWFGWFYAVNWDLVVGVQGARWEGLIGCKIFAEVCDLGSLGMNSVGGCFTLGESL